MAQSQLYTQKAQIHLIEETSIDTYLVQTAGGADAVLAEEVTVTYDTSPYEPQYIRGDFLSFDEIPGMVSGTFAFRVPIRGSGTAGTAPECGEMLKACGFEEETVATTSVTYSPVSIFDGTGGNPGPSYSLSFLLNGVKHSLKGAFGNLVITCNVGEPGFFEYSFQGAYNTFADDALESTSYDTTAAQPFLGATFATNFGGANTPLGLRTFSVDMGNKIAVRQDFNDPNGIMGVRIAGRKSTGAFDCEHVLAATWNPYSIHRAGTAGTIVTGSIGATAGNIYDININRAKLRMPELSQTDGIARTNIPYGISSAATDVEDTNHDIEIVFT